MRAGLCRDVLLEIYHLLLIDKDIYQQAKGKADGEELRHGQPLHLRFDIIGQTKPLSLPLTRRAFLRTRSFFTRSRKPIMEI